MGRSPSRSTPGSASSASAAQSVASQRMTISCCFATIATGATTCTASARPSRSRQRDLGLVTSASKYSTKSKRKKRPSWKWSSSCLSGWILSSNPEGGEPYQPYCENILILAVILCFLFYQFLPQGSLLIVLFSSCTNYALLHLINFYHYL